MDLRRDGTHALSVGAISVVLSVALWSAVAGGPCGSVDRQWLGWAAGWVVPFAVAAAVGRFALRARWLALGAGLVVGLAVAFALWAYVLFGACG